MSSINYVALLDNNPIKGISNEYHIKLLDRIKTIFSNDQQKMFIACFYCFLNYDPVKDFVINLDDVWEWMGFSKKYNAKFMLCKSFKEDIDFKIFVKEEKTARGGNNKETILLNVMTFKLMCLKAGTKKADEIHEYFVKLEDMVHRIVEEEAEDFKQQLIKKDEDLLIKDKELQQKQISHEVEKEILVENTLLAQFPLNTQCIYIGKIDNKSGGIPGHKAYQESLIKFGQSNNLAQRVMTHKKNFTNFRLVAAYKVKNKIEIENAIKKHAQLKKRMRILRLPAGPEQWDTYKEIIALDDDKYTLESIDEYFKQIIQENEYNPENYRLLIEKNETLENRIRDLEEQALQREREMAKLQAELTKETTDIAKFANRKIASDFTTTNCGYHLYAFESEPFRYKCGIARPKDMPLVEQNLKLLHPNGSVRFQTIVKHPFLEKIMIFLLKANTTSLGSSVYEGSGDIIQRIIESTAALEKRLVEGSKDMATLEAWVQDFSIPKAESEENIDPQETRQKKGKVQIDQIDPRTHQVVNTFASIEAAGRTLGLTTGTAIGIALREGRVCQGFLWRYAGTSKEQQYTDQAVIRVRCSDGEHTLYKTIAEAAAQAGISAPGLRQRILRHIHSDGFHWIFAASQETS